MTFTLEPTQLLLLTLSLLAGAVQMSSPDRWVPGSLMSWQRAWTPGKDRVFPFLALAFHLGAGFLLYLALSPWLMELPTQTVFVASLSLVAVGALIRAIQSGSVHRLFQQASQGKRSLFRVLMILGPCEVLVPVLYKGKALGMGLLLPFAVFAAGSIATGALLHRRGRERWNAPERLVDTLAWAQSRGTTAPVAAGLVLGVILITGLR